MRQALGDLALLSALINLCAAVYVIFRDPRRLENRLFAALAFILAVTCVGEYLMTAGTDAHTVLAGSRLSITMWLLVAPVFLHFTMEVTGWPGRRRRGYLVAIYSVCYAFAVVTASTGLVIKGVDFISTAVNMNHEIGGPLWYPATMLSGLLYSTGAAILLFAGRSSESRAERQSRHILIVATLLPVASIGLIYLLLPLFDIRVPIGYSFFTPFLAVFVAYAVTRYNLMTTVGSRVGSTLVSNIREAVLLTGDKGTIELANEAAARLTGYSIAELEGRKLAGLVEERGTGAPGGEESNMVTIITSDGLSIPATKSVSPLRNRRGGLLGSVVILHDMREALHVMRVEREAREAEMAAEAERSRAESLEKVREELGEQNEFLQMVLDNLAEPVFIKDHRLHYIYTNEAFLEFVGLDRDRVIDSTASEVFDVDAANPMVISDLEAFETGSVVVLEDVALKVEGGKDRVLRALKAPVMDARGRPEYLIGVIQDLTEQKQLEKARLDFVRIAAHELRTPLTSLRLAAEMLERSMADRMDEQEARTLDVMMLSLQRLILLSRNLLDLASLDAGTLALKPVTVDIGSFLSEVVSTFQYELADKNIEMDIDCPQGLPAVEADPARLWQVIANLLSNAIKFTDEGEIGITVAESDGAIEVCVADTGCGIEKQYVGTIFSRFSKAQDVQCARSGTGLGLPIARGIIEAHGGRIWCESEPGRGSRFYFTIRKAIA